MARFWSIGARGSGALAESIAAHAEPTFDEAVEVYTPTAMVFGMVEPAGKRLSDMLNDNSVLAVRDARSTSMVPGVDGTEGNGWARIDRDEILFVMPPEHQSPRALRIHRRQHRVHLEVGSYQIVGNAHVAPGTPLDIHVMSRRQRFVPITNAYVQGTGADTVFERSAPVVLVNVSHIATLRDMLTVN